ncbi:MAG: AraC family transcriptional regulator [Clostridia bacterium]|nr:AraC family transcriptional regulator [Clostridia bacterium]
MKAYYEMVKSNHMTFGRMETVDFPAHFHSAVELIYILSGRERVCIDGKTAELGAGSLAVSYPYQVHEYTKLEDGLKFFFIIQPQCFSTGESMFASTIPENPFYHYEGGEREYLDAILQPLLLSMGSKKRCTISIDSHSYYSPLITALLMYHLEYVGTEQLTHRPIEAELIRRIMCYLDVHYDDPSFNTYDAAQDIGISTQYLSSLIKKNTGYTFKEHLHNLRINKARLLLRDTSLSISEVAMESGFLSIRTFNRVFIERSGMTPRDWRTTDHPHKWHNPLS